MFLKLDKNTGDAVLFFLENNFQNINNWIDFLQSYWTFILVFHFFRDIIHNFYTDSQNGPQPMRARVLPNVISKKNLKNGEQMFWKET